MNYLIYGNSYKLIDSEIKKIVGDNDYKTYSLDDISLDEILEDVTYNSMFDDRKILVIKNFDMAFESKKDNTLLLENLNSYLSKPNNNTILIFITNTKISEKSKLNKEILSHLKEIKTPIFTKPYELAKALGDFIRDNGYGMSQNALNMFVAKCACNYDVAIMEFEKLKEIKKNNRLISEEDIKNLVSNYNMNDSFAFKDAVINRDIKACKEMIDDLEASKMEIVPLVVMLAKEYQLLYDIKELASKRLTNDEISSKLGGMHVFRVKLLREASSKYKTEELLAIIKFLCNLDLKLVSEDNLGYDELRKLLLIL